MSNSPEGAKRIAGIFAVGAIETYLESVRNPQNFPLFEAVDSDAVEFMEASLVEIQELIEEGKKLEAGGCAVEAISSYISQVQDAGGSNAPSYERFLKKQAAIERLSAGETLKSVVGNLVFPGGVLEPLLSEPS